MCPRMRQFSDNNSHAWYSTSRTWGGSKHGDPRVWICDTDMIEERGFENHGLFIIHCL